MEGWWPGGRGQKDGSTASRLAREPFAYLEDVLERMSNGHPMSSLDDLLPWNWRPITTFN